MHNKSYIAIFIKKLNIYPLFFEKGHRLPANRIAIKFLFYDLIRVVKSLGITIELSRQFFNGFENFCYLIKLIFRSFSN